jgi:serine/threonine protein kinase
MADGTGARDFANQPAGDQESFGIPVLAIGTAPPADMPAQLGRYRIKQRLGGGSMGAVYLVENTEVQREEALKIPHLESGSDPAVRERFLRSARAAAKLDHPNICPIYDVGVIDGSCFLTMRFLQGQPLSVLACQARPPMEAVEIIFKLAQALEHAHARGVIHRDLKPSNIMMCPESGPTVFDFGLARQTQQANSTLTQAGTMMGTPAYMPPEQVKGDLDRIGPLSDVYSLGVILFELLTGRRPFDGSTAEVIGKVLYEPNPAPSGFQPGLSPAVDGVCGRAMAKKPEDRYPSMTDFADALADVLRTLPAKREATPGTRPAASERSREFFHRSMAHADQSLGAQLAPERESLILPEEILDATMTDEAKAPAPATLGRRTLVVLLCLGLLVGCAVVAAIWLFDRHEGEKTADQAIKAPAMEKAIDGPVKKDAAKEPQTGPRDTAALDAKVFIALRDVINRGSHLYNDGDPAACYRLYEGSLMTLRPLLDSRPDLQKAIADDLARVERDPTMWRRAFTLRGVLDKIRAAVNPKKDKKPDETLPPAKPDDKMPIDKTKADKDD